MERHVNNTASRTREWIEIGRQPVVVRRAMGYAVIVGTILVFINHGDALTKGTIEPLRLLRMGLTVIVPYIVSTLSSIQAVQTQERVTATRCEKELADASVRN